MMIHIDLVADISCTLSTVVDSADKVNKAKECKMTELKEPPY